MKLEICFFIFPGFELLDLSGPMTAFLAADGHRAQPGYRVRVASLDGGLVASTAGPSVTSAPAADIRPDTLIVVGGQGARKPVRRSETVALVRRLSASARRTASVCTGAFLLAEAGILDGRRATTHWRHAPSFQRAYGRVRVESDAIFIRDGQVWTSAGITAGIDLALALIEEDSGAEIARKAAKELVVYYRRPGGQSQFSELLDLEPETDRIRSVLAYARAHLAESLTVEHLAEVACLSARQFSRAFKQETGVTPARMIELLRLEAAKQMVENGSEPIERIAPAVGWSDPERMRRAFVRRYGHPPQSLRRARRVGR